MLNFSGEWWYHSLRAVPSGVEDEFIRTTIAVMSAGCSTDLERVMSEASENAPLFVEAFYDACEALESRYPEMTMPGVEQIETNCQVIDLKKNEIHISFVLRRPLI